MTVLLDALALLLTVAALTCGAVVLASTHRWAAALAVFLDLLTAAGLLRLAGEPSYRRALTAALLLLIRRVVGLGLRQGARARATTAAPAGRDTRAHG